MTSELTLLEVEQAANFQQHRQSYLQRFQPHDDIELDLVDQLVSASWRIRRIWAMETAAYNRQFDNQSFSHSLESTLFDTFGNFSAVFAKLSALEARLNRVYQRTLATLQALRKAPPSKNSTDSTQFDTFSDSETVESPAPPENKDRKAKQSSRAPKLPMQTGPTPRCRGA